MSIFSKTVLQRCFACFFLVCSMHLRCAPAFALPGEILDFKPPAGFTEIKDHDDPLFSETKALAVAHGKLIKMFLPQYMAHQYRHGNRSAITRQILICEPDIPARQSVSEHEAELLARSMEGLFTGFARVPHGRMDTPAQEIEHRKNALQQSLDAGTPLLVDALRIQQAWLFTYLIHYSMDKNENIHLTSAMSCSVVSASDRAIFITVSSILESNDAETELEWVKDTASAFIAAITRHAKKNSAK